MQVFILAHCILISHFAQREEIGGREIRGGAEGEERTNSDHQRRRHMSKRQRST